MLASAPQASGSCRPARPALCTAPRAARQLGRRAACRPAAQQQQQPPNCESGGGGGGGASPQEAAADRQRLELAGVRDRLAAAQAQLAHCIAEQAYGAAAEARDAVDALELRERSLALGLAAQERAGVLHSIGQVIVHKRFSYRGVIVGADPRCLAPEEWCLAMRVDSLPLGRAQPYFHVLVDVRDRPGGQTTCVAQENIVSVRAPRPVRHPLVDQLFIRFDPEAGTYIAGPQLRSAFPHEF